MPCERLVGINVTDEKMYEKYREAMKPILVTYGGGFSSDFKVSETLLPSANTDINRVFTIYCRDEKAMDQFFSNPDYLEIKDKFFKNSVANVTELAKYNRQA